MVSESWTLVILLGDILIVLIVVTLVIDNLGTTELSPLTSMTCTFIKVMTVPEQIYSSKSEDNRALPHFKPPHPGVIYTTGIVTPKKQSS